ncbi:MAG: FG-GAP repeat domain-containing protein [Candidatus Hydrothermia bacterium]
MRKLGVLTMLMVVIPSLVGAKLQIYDALDFSATKGFNIVPDTTPDGTVSIDTLNVYSPSTAVTLRRVKGARNFKGPNDDTLRLVMVQSATPRAVLLLTDTSSNAFSAFRVDTIFNVAQNPQGLALGDIDNDGYTEIFIANFGTPKRFYVGKWRGNSFEFDSITVTEDGVFNLAFADADNDGLGEVCIPADSELYVLQRWVSSQDYTMDTIYIGD